MARACALIISLGLTAACTPDPVGQGDKRAPRDEAAEARAKQTYASIRKLLENLPDKTAASGAPETCESVSGSGAIPVVGAELAAAILEKRQFGARAVDPSIDASEPFWKAFAIASQEGAGGDAPYGNFLDNELAVQAAAAPVVGVVYTEASEPGEFSGLLALADVAQGSALCKRTISAKTPLVPEPARDANDPSDKADLKRARQGTLRHALKREVSRELEAAVRELARGREAMD